MRCVLQTCVVRSWRHEDVDALVRYANNRKIWLNLRDAFPHPYSRSDAEQWLRFATEQRPETHFAVEVDREAAGGVGYRLGEDIGRRSAEIGYWVAEPYWGRGIATEALRAVTDHAMTAHGLVRLFAIPFEGNVASFRVLEKAGYRCEGRLRRAVVKAGRVMDARLYACTIGPNSEEDNI